MNPTSPEDKPLPHPLTVAVRVRDGALEEPLRQRFALGLPDASLIIRIGTCDAFADIDSVSGDCDGPDKPMVKAQEIVGEFNSAMRERNETNAPAHQS
jgi:hypothetical protein